MRDRYFPSIWNRLTTDVVEPGGSLTSLLLNVEAIKTRVANDLEALLNTRLGPELAPEDGLLVPRGVVGFGLRDFAHLGAGSVGDVAAVCRYIEEAISTHEARLKRVRVSAKGVSGSIGRWKFEVAAELILNRSAEPVSFEAVMDSSKHTFMVDRLR